MFKSIRELSLVDVLRKGKTVKCESSFECTYYTSTSVIDLTDRSQSVYLIHIFVIELQRTCFIVPFSAGLRMTHGHWNPFYA